MYTMEYYPTMRKKEILTFVIIWVDLESIMLTETSWMVEATSVWYCLYEESKNIELIETKSRMMVASAWGVGEIGELFIISYKL